MQHNATALECICPCKICTEGGIHKSLDILETARLLGVRHWMAAAQKGLPVLGWWKMLWDGLFYLSTRSIQPAPVWTRPSSLPRGTRSEERGETWQ